MKLPERNNQRGMSQLGIVLIVAVAVIVVIFWLLLKNYISTLETSVNPSITQTPSPTFAWLKYENTDPLFSLSYPNTYYPVKDLVGYKRIKALFAMSFVPYDKTKVESDSVFLTVFTRGGVSLSSWVDSHTTTYAKGDAKLGGKTYTYYNVKGKKAGITGDYDTVEFTVNFPDANTSLFYTALVSSKYIFLLSYTPGNVQSVYQQILSSLIF